ncbi:MAG: ABC transporter ATP-binding protein [Deltaproteobacteria bacterium]|nr:ABC transporter ATP-binding protein [Deltaproteobacteria bacterium]
MSLSLEAVTKRVGREIHLDNINLEFETGSRNVLLGHTLAGKTSLLRMMAGLDRPTSGKILVNGDDVTGIKVRRRNIAMVYQQFVNYPSLTVYDNIASPLRLSGENRKEIDRRVRETAAMLHLDPLLDRLPAELSGGQQQRTAIARALAKKSDLLLLDEPLVNLDFKLREELRVELQEIFTQRKAVVVYTTTEPAEALMLGGNIVIIDKGRVLQTGSTEDVYRNPATRRVADIFSDPPMNYLNGTVSEGVARLGSGITIPLKEHLKSLPAGEYIFGVRSHHLFLSRTSEDDALIDATVALSEINGSETFIHADYDSSRLVIQASGIHPFRIGAPITIHVNPCSFFVYDESGALVASPDHCAFEGGPL